MSGFKLQKLVYYAQAWHLVWRERPLFSEGIEAWSNGPVVPELWERHKGRFTVDTVGGDPSGLDAAEESVVDLVLVHYGQKPGEYLSSLTHDEDPWKGAREGLSDGQPGRAEISLESMSSFYEHEPPGGRGMELDLTPDQLASILEGEADLAHGRVVRIGDLQRELRSSPR